MNWVKNHTCENCRWSAKGWIDKGIFVKSNDYYAKHCCIKHNKELPGVIDYCTCDCWTEDCEVIAKKMIKEECCEGALKFCKCGHKPRCFRRVFSDNGIDDWAVWCECCDAMTVADTKHGAISLWNNGY